MLELLYWLVVSGLLVVCADYVLSCNAPIEPPQPTVSDMKGVLIDYANELAKIT
jgi:hypothetical protein